MSLLFRVIILLNTSSFFENIYWASTEKKQILKGLHKL